MKVVAELGVLEGFASISNLMGPETATIFSAAIAGGAVLLNLYGGLLTETKKTDLARQMELERTFRQQVEEMRSITARYRGPLLEASVDFEQRIFHLITLSGEWYNGDTITEEEVVYTLFTLAQLLGFLEVVRREGPRERNFVQQSNMQGTDTLATLVEGFRFVMAANQQSLEAWYMQPDRPHPGARPRSDKPWVDEEYAEAAATVRDTVSRMAVTAAVQKSRDPAGDSVQQLLPKPLQVRYSGSPAGFGARHLGFTSTVAGAYGGNAVGPRPTQTWPSVNDIYAAAGFTPAAAYGNGAATGSYNSGSAGNAVTGPAAYGAAGSVNGNGAAAIGSYGGNATVYGSTIPLYPPPAAPQPPPQQQQQQTLDNGVYAASSSSQQQQQWPNGANGEIPAPLVTVPQPAMAASATAVLDAREQPQQPQWLAGPGPRPPQLPKTVLNITFVSDLCSPGPRQFSACLLPGTNILQRPREQTVTLPIYRETTLRVSRGMQRAVGSAMIITPMGAKRHYTMSYSEFFKRFQYDEEFTGWFRPLFNDILALMSCSSRKWTGQAPFPFNRWSRILLLQQLLIEAMELLDPNGVRVPSNRRVKLSPVDYGALPNVDSYKQRLAELDAFFAHNPLRVDDRGNIVAAGPPNVAGSPMMQGMPAGGSGNSLFQSMSLDP